MSELRAAPSPATTPGENSTNEQAATHGDRRLRRALGKTFLRAFGWHADGGPPAVQQAVVIAAPHTSNWDLVFAIAVACAIDVDIRWIGKHTLFQGPMGPFMRAIGGIGVDRRGRHNAVAAAAALLRDYAARGEPLLLLVPPEGTRGKARRWKTGFYYIAEAAGVPVVLGFLDYGRKRGGLGTLFWPTGDLAADFAQIRDFYSAITAKYPDQMGAVTIEGVEAEHAQAPPSLDASK